MNEIRDLIHTRKPGVCDEDISNAEKGLGVNFPTQYRELLKMVNSPEVDEWIFYPIKDSKNVNKTWDDLIRNNKDGNVRWDHMPEELIAFASDGTGDQLCFKVVDKQLEDVIYLWNHETGEVEEVATNLKELIYNLLR